MKTKSYAMLAFVLLISVLTLCLAGRAIPKTPQHEQDAKTDATSQSQDRFQDMLQSWHTVSKFSESEIEALLYLYSKQTTEQRDTLKGLHGVEVVVESLEAEAEKHGLTKKALQTAVELRLRQHGIKVNPGEPFLYIHVNAFVNEAFSFSVVTIRVKFVQPAVLLLNPKIRAYVITWQYANTFLYSLDKLRGVRENVLDFVDKFINDYLAANPKEQPIEEPKKPIDFRPAMENNKKPKND